MAELRVPGVQRNPHLSGPWVAFEDVSTRLSQVVLWNWKSGLVFVPHPSTTDQVLNDVSLVVGAYLSLAVAVLFKLLPTTSLLAMLSLPLLVRAIRASELGAIGQQRAIAMIDIETAELYATFGLLLTIGLALARVMP